MNITVELTPEEHQIVAAVRAADTKAGEKAFSGSIMLLADYQHGRRRGVRMIGPVMCWPDGNLN